MFGLGFSEIVLLGLLALLLIGPKELPEVARVIGRFVNDLKRSSEHLTEEIKAQARFQDPTEGLKDTLYERAKLKEENTNDTSMSESQMELPLQAAIDQEQAELASNMSSTNSDLEKKS